VSDPIPLPADALAAVFDEAGKPLRMERFPLPTLAGGEVLVRIDRCTICGSDLGTFLGRRSTPTPTILGHEMVGTVAALPDAEPPADVDRRPLAIGDRVTWSIAASCGTCFFCSRGVPQKCERLFKYGHEAIDDSHPLSGAMAEFCHLAPGTAVVRVPDDVPDDVACPANCATATVSAAVRLAGGVEGKTVLILGAGMLGLTAAAMAVATGAEAVIVAEPDPDRREQATAFGATHALPAEGIASAARDLTGGHGVDATLELSGHPDAVRASLDALRIGGTCVWVGATHPVPSLEVNPERIVRSCLTVRGLHNYTPADLVTAVRFLAGNHARFPFAQLVAASFPLAEANAAMERRQQRDAVRVALVP
jgi:alcohol dehydrogenase